MSRPIDFMPPMLGGPSHNDWRHMNNDWPFVTDPSFAPQLKFYYLVSAGFHFAQLYKFFVHMCVLGVPENVFEHLLYYYVAAFLFCSSYVTGFFKIGGLVIFLHDVSYIPKALLNLSDNLAPVKPYERTFQFLTLITFAYFRLYVLNYIVWYPIKTWPREYMFLMHRWFGHLDRAKDFIFAYMMGQGILLWMLAAVHFNYWRKLLAKVYRIYFPEIRLKDE